MTCESLTDIILDMARGAAVPEAARFSVRRHMDTCPSCAAEYARQRELTTALQALAADAQEWSAPAGMEQRLLAAFAAQNGKPATGDARPTSRRWRYVLATAAMVTLAVWGITREAGQPASRPGVSERSPQASPAANPRTATLRTADPVVSERGGNASRTTNPPSRSALPPSPSLRRTSRRDRPVNPVAGERARQASRTTTPIEFVSIPSAIGLPDLESGTVLRMELPLTALPEFGLQIAPDAMRTSIEADVLVGQDGQPRAIRLVGGPGQRDAGFEEQTMKRELAIGVVVLISVASGHAQEPVTFTRATEVQSMTPARVATTVVETRITTGRPYSAEATTEFVQTLGDGNKIARKSTVRIYRDGEGRTRREELAADGTVRLVSIYDPITHITYVLDPATRTARKSAVRVVTRTMQSGTDGDKRKAETRVRMEMEAGQRVGGTVTLVAPRELPAASEEMLKRQIEIAATAGASGSGVLQPVSKDSANAREESLGQKLIDGVLADGKRVTTVMPAGSIGNQQPISVLSEQWFAPDLEILVMTKHSDPRTGETTYSLSNITRGEPAPSLFDVPSDYTIQESSYIRTPATR